MRWHGSWRARVLRPGAHVLPPSLPAGRTLWPAPSSVRAAISPDTPAPTITTSTFSSRPAAAAGPEARACIVGRHVVTQAGGRRAGGRRVCPLAAAAVGPHARHRFWLRACGRKLLFVRSPAAAEARSGARQRGASSCGLGPQIQTLGCLQELTQAAQRALRAHPAWREVCASFGTPGPHATEQSRERMLWSIAMKMADRVACSSSSYRYRSDRGRTSRRTHWWPRCCMRTA